MLITQNAQVKDGLEKEECYCDTKVPYSVWSNSHISLVVLSSKILTQIVLDMHRIIFLATFTFAISQSSTTLQVSCSMELLPSRGCKNPQWTWYRPSCTVSISGMLWLHQGKGQHWRVCWIWWDLRGYDQHWCHLSERLKEQRIKWPESFDWCCQWWCMQSSLILMASSCYRPYTWMSDR